MKTHKLTIQIFELQTTGEQKCDLQIDGNKQVLAMAVCQLLRVHDDLREIVLSALANSMIGNGAQIITKEEKNG